MFLMFWAIHALFSCMNKDIKEYSGIPFEREGVKEDLIVIGK